MAVVLFLFRDVRKFWFFVLCECQKMTMTRNLKKEKNMKKISIVKGIDKRYYITLHFLDVFGDIATAEYRTDYDGYGLYLYMPAKHEWKQISGTCQFRMNQKTYSGKYNYVKKELYPKGE